VMMEAISAERSCNLRNAKMSHWIVPSVQRHNNLQRDGLRGTSIEAEQARVARRMELRHIRADLPHIRLRKDAGVSTRRQALTNSVRHYRKGAVRKEAGEATLQHDS
jgi:hypothetical protein